MKIFIGSDHAGFELKGKLIPFIKNFGHDIEDKGAFVYNEVDDYPDFVSLVAEAVSEDPEARGIVLGGSGQGEAMCANKYKGIRAVEYYGPSRGVSIIQDSRSHNDSNILSLGARFINEEEAKVAVKEWLETPFSGDERHIRRIKKMDML